VCLFYVPFKRLERWTILQNLPWNYAIDGNPEWHRTIRLYVHDYKHGDDAEIWDYILRFRAYAINSLQGNQKSSSISNNNNELQKTAILGTAHILREVVM